MRHGGDHGHCSEKELILYVIGDLDEAHARSTGRHLLDCPRCRARAAAFEDWLRAFLLLTRGRRPARRPAA